jgi:hypothetical protein
MRRVFQAAFVAFPLVLHGVGAGAETSTAGHGLSRLSPVALRP